MNAEEYWRQQAQSATHEYDHVLDSQRDEIERLQRRCSELTRECSLARAHTAADVRRFCLAYAGRNNNNNSSSSSSSSSSVGGYGRQHTPPILAAHTPVSALWRGCVADETAVPLTVLLQFLHEYSNGMVPQPENTRKRDRSYSLVGSSSTATTAPGASTPTSSRPLSPSFAHNRRLYCRVLARQRRSGHHDDADADEWSTVDGHASATQTALWPSTAVSNNNNNSGRSSSGSGVTLARHTLRGSFCAAPSQGGEDARRGGVCGGVCAGAGYAGGGGGGGPLRRAALSYATQQTSHTTHSGDNDGGAEGGGGAVGSGCASYCAYSGDVAADGVLTTAVAGVNDDGARVAAAAAAAGGGAVCRGDGVASGRYAAAAHDASVVVTPALFGLPRV